jgi:hypothetical protein
MQKLSTVKHRKKERKHHWVISSGPIPVFGAAEEKGKQMFEEILAEKNT